MVSYKNTTHRVSDHREDILSFGTRQLFEVVNYIFLCTFVGLFGIGTNSVNMAVFYKQGFHNTMTINFMALAVSDICCLITLQWFNVCMNPLLSSSSVSFSPLEIHSLTAGWPHISFGRITGWITAYITAERCLCITAPMSVRRIITPRRTTCILVVIYFMNIMTVVPVYATSHIGWKFYPEKNRSLLGLLATNHNVEAEGWVFFLHALLVIISFMCVTVLTVVLVIRLNLASEWRHRATGGKHQDEAMSHKDKRTTRMVIMISSLLIIMYTPGIILSLVTFIEPKFGIFGAYRNLFMSLWSFGFLFNATNSSVNIFMYYHMSSKYRDTFREIFLAGTQRNNIMIATYSCS